MSKKALVLLSPGTEDMEIVITADVLRRCGVDVKIAGVEGSEPVACARKTIIVPDAALEACKQENYDVVVLPGGLGGMKAMCASTLVGEILRKQESSGGLIAAICAAPVALATHGICLGKQLTSYPSFKDTLDNQYEYVDNKNVVQDSNLITSRGPGTAFEFALFLSALLAGQEKADAVAKEMLV